MALFFLQETHSFVEDEKQLSDNFKKKIFYSHGTTNCCGVKIAFLGSKSFEAIETRNNYKGRSLILDIEKELLLVNI